MTDSARKNLLDRARAYSKKTNLNEWHKSEPWKLTREDIEAGKFPGIRVTDSALAASGGARLGTINEDEILVAPEYFKLDDNGRAALLYHEAAHFVQAAFTAREDFVTLAEPFRDDKDRPVDGARSTWGGGLNATEFPAYKYGELLVTTDNSWRDTEIDAPDKVAFWRALADDAEEVGFPSGRVGTYDRSANAPTTQYGTPLLKYHAAEPIEGLSPGTKRATFAPPSNAPPGDGDFPKRFGPPTEDTYRNIAPQSLAAMYRNEGFDDVQGRFLAGEEAATARLMGFYKQARAEMLTFIAGQGDPTPNDVTFYENLIAERDRVTDELQAGAKEWIDGTIPIAFVEGARTQNAGVGFTAVHDKAVEALSQDTLSLITNTNEGIRRSVQQTIASGILEGLSSGEMARRMAAGGLQPGPWKSVEERAGVIARTETMRAYNAGNIVGAQSSGAPFVEWIAADDEKTCEICGPRDGKRYRTPGFDPGRLGVTEPTPSEADDMAIPWARDAEEAGHIADALAEAAAHPEGTESLWIVGGDQTFRQDGGVGEVRFSPEAEEWAVGGHVIHNHPGGRPLSVEDLEVAANMGTATMSAVGSGGRYTVVPGADGWGDAKDIRSYYDRTWNRLADAEATRHLPSNDLLDVTLAATAKHFGWTYESGVPVSPSPSSDVPVGSTVRPTINPLTSRTAKSASNELLTSHVHGSSDEFMTTLGNEIGFGGRPEVLSRTALDAYVANGEIEMFRGETRPSHADAFMTGDYRVGKGNYGNGQYAAFQSSVPHPSGLKERPPIDEAAIYAKNYRDDGEPGVVMRMTLKADANVIDYNEALDAYQNDAEVDAILNPEGSPPGLRDDLGRWAMLRGYDAIVVDGTPSYDGTKTVPVGHVVILNRTAVRVQKDIAREVK